MKVVYCLLYYIVQVTEQNNGSKKSRRIYAHSHIKGLGLDDSGKAISIDSGLVGQEKAREVGLFFEYEINRLGCWDGCRYD